MAVFDFLSPRRKLELEAPDPNTPIDEVEFLARVEHDRWVEERTRAGWTYGAEKDVERRVSPYLVGWEELSDEVREYDRAPMREMIALVESAGLAVTR